MSERVFAIYLPSGYLYGFRYKEEDAQQMCDEEDGRTYKELVPIDRIRELERACPKCGSRDVSNINGEAICGGCILEAKVDELEGRLEAVRNVPQVVRLIDVEQSDKMMFARNVLEAAGGQ